MATVMEFRCPPDAFPLGSVFESLPSATVELERLVPQDTTTIPYFWVRGAAADDIEAAFDSHAGLTNVTLVDHIDSEYLMRAEWDREYEGILNALVEFRIVLLASTGRQDGWQFEVRSEERAEISDFRSYCQEHDIQIDITAVHELHPVQADGYDLTDTQREALDLAYERGYFDSPRETTLAEIASELGITQQSLSSRLRRGHKRLLAATIADE